MHVDRGERGAELVEFAVVGLLLFAIVFAIIDFGFAFSDTLELRSASREGARLAAVDNGCANNSCSAQTPDQQRDAIIAATRAKANGLANASSIQISVSCSADPCSSAAVGVDSVTVCLNYTFHSVTGFLGPVLDGKVLRSRATMRLEQVPSFSAGTDTGGPGAATCT